MFLFTFVFGVSAGDRGQSSSAGRGGPRVRLEAFTTFETVSIHRRYVGRDGIGRGPAALKLSVLMVLDCAAGQPKVE